MPPKDKGRPKPPNIIVKLREDDGLTFNNTSLQPFLRAYTRMESGERGGGDRQFRTELNLARRILEEQERWSQASPGTIHELISNITNPDSSVQRLYPTMKNQGVNNDEAFENRIIITILLMQHARDDRANGADGGVTRGGLWLPPTAPGRRAQEEALEQGLHPRYPQWNRTEAQANTPSRSANFTSTGVPPGQWPQPGGPRPQGSQGYEVSRHVDPVIGTLPPFSATYSPTMPSPLGPPAGDVHGQPYSRMGGPPFVTPGGYNVPSRGIQQLPQPGPRRQYGRTPPPPPQSPPRDNRYYNNMEDAYGPGPSVPRNYHNYKDMVNHQFWSNQGGTTTRIPPPHPAIAAVGNLVPFSPFAAGTSSPSRSSQAPIGSDRPRQGTPSRSGGGSVRGTPSRGTPSRAQPGSSSSSHDRTRSGGGVSVQNTPSRRSHDAGWGNQSGSRRGEQNDDGW